MLGRICLISLLFFVPSATAQIGSPPAYPQAEVRMQLPPPVSSMGLPNVVGAAELSNYLRGDISFSGGYVNNLYPGSGNRTIDDSTFSFQPGLSMDRTTDRIQETLRYAPAFDYYSPNGSLNTVNQTGNADFQYRFTPYATLFIGDSATKTSTTWSQPLPSGSVSGNLPPTSPGFIAPFAPQISNNAYAQFAWQLARNSMIGLGGNATFLDYYKPSQAQGLFDSNSRSGSAYYTQRFGSRQYIGGLYQYSLILATPVSTTGPANTNLDAHNFLGFYTIYFQPSLSVSLGAGSQDYNLTQSSIKPIRAWAPIAVGSIGWQVPRASFALNYSRLVTEGEGIIGAYTSNAGNLSTQLQLSPHWIATISGTYSQFTPVSEFVMNSTPGGHTLSFAGMLERRLGVNLTLSVRYQYLHQNYLGIASIASSPESSRETASITYHLSRLLGR